MLQKDYVHGFLYICINVYAYIHCNLSAAAYYTAVATIAAIIGQHVVRRLITIFGRASLIIFILAFMIFVSAISLGKY